MEEEKDNAAEAPAIYQHMSHLQHQMAKDDPERKSVEASRTETCGHDSGVGWVTPFGIRHPAFKTELSP